MEVPLDGEPPCQDKSHSDSQVRPTAHEHTPPPTSLPTDDVFQQSPFFIDLTVMRLLRRHVDENLLDVIRLLLRSLLKGLLQLGQHIRLILLHLKKIVPVILLDRFQQRTLGLNGVTR